MTREREAENWEKRRRALVHDSLKNRMNPALAKLCAVLEKTVEDPTYVESLASLLGNGQYSIESEAEWLARNAADALSPKMLFALEPLSGLDSNTLEWFPDAMHELWVAKVDLVRAVNAVADVTEEFVVERKRLSVCLAGNSDSQSLESARHLQHLCDKLGTLLTGMGALVPSALAQL